jgi:uncharacterized membrane protein YcaP (DUF421 family)
VSAADIIGVYVAIVLGMRLTGTRQLGQMTPFDLVLVLLIANAVQNAMVGSDVSILGGILAAGTLLAMNRATAIATERLPFFRRALEGEPSLLLNDGKLIESHIKRAGLTDELVLQAIREHGFEDETQVRMAVLEIDGTISIVPAGTATVRTRHGCGPCARRNWRGGTASSARAQRAVAAEPVAARRDAPGRWLDLARRARWRVPAGRARAGLAPVDAARSASSAPATCAAARGRAGQGGA